MSKHCNSEDKPAFEWTLPRRLLLAYQFLFPDQSLSTGFNTMQAFMEPAAWDLIRISKLCALTFLY